MFRTYVHLLCKVQLIEQKNCKVSTNEHRSTVLDSTSKDDGYTNTDLYTTAYHCLFINSTISKWSYFHAISSHDSTTYKCQLMINLRTHSYVKIFYHFVPRFH